MGALLLVVAVQAGRVGVLMAAEFWFCNPDPRPAVRRVVIIRRNVARNRELLEAQRRVNSAGHTWLGKLKPIHPHEAG